MKKLVIAVLLLLTVNSKAQDNQALVTHFENYYQQMRLQADVNGIINALTHLNILKPSKARLDTLAFVYMNNGQHMQALNTIGVEKLTTDSDLAIQVKAISLKAINQPQRAIEQFNVLQERKPNPMVAYELADLQIQIGQLPEAEKNIEYGIANATQQMKHAFFERQQPYEVSLKAAFLHLKGLLHYNKDKENIDQALTYINEALSISPNFNLASLSKQALESRKEAAQTPE